MKMRQFYILALIFYSFSLVGYSQSIIAGRHNANDYIHEFSPDSVIYTYWEYPPENYIDINGDKINDFYFKSESFGMIEHLSYCSLNTLNGTQFAASYTDTCWNASGDFFGEYLMAHGFLLDEIVDGNSEWSVSPVYIHYCQQSYYDETNCYKSFSPGKYVGFRIPSTSDTLYGWIKLGADLCTVDFRIFIGGYACNNPQDNSIYEKNEIPELRIYPNPASDYINISLTRKPGINGELKIYNYSGGLVYQCDYKEYINLKDLKNGIYFIKYLDGNFCAFQKIIVMKQE